MELSRFILPAPCSYRLMPGMRTAPSTSACFMLAGFSTPPCMCHLAARGRQELSIFLCLARRLTDGLGAAGLPAAEVSHVIQVRCECVLGFHIMVLLHGQLARSPHPVSTRRGQAVSSGANRGSLAAHPEASCQHNQAISTTSTERLPNPKKKTTPERARKAHLRSSGTTLASRQTAPATTGDATEVPDRLRQPPWMRLPITSRPYATTSGCAQRDRQL